jgi:predicted alpha/beta hydrolase
MKISPHVTFCAITQPSQSIISISVLFTNLTMKQPLRITASDGFQLSVTSFLPSKSNGKVILINSATGVKQKFYSDFASYLSEQGFIVYTYDYRGIGDSRPTVLEQFEAYMHEWGTLDYHAVLKYLFLSYTDCEFTVIGHSVGGQVIGMSPLSENVDNIVMIGSQVPYYRFYHGRRLKTKLFAFWNLVIPFFTYTFGYFPASSLGLFEDLPSGVALQWARWAKSKKYIFDELPFLKERFSALQQRSLMLSFTDDQYAPKAAVKRLIEIYSNLRWEHKHLHPEDLAQKKVGHFGFFKKATSHAFWNDISEWITSNSTVKESKAA